MPSVRTADARAYSQPSQSIFRMSSGRSEWLRGGKSASASTGETAASADATATSLRKPPMLPKSRVLLSMGAGRFINRSPAQPTQPAHRVHPERRGPSVAAAKGSNPMPWQPWCATSSSSTVVSADSPYESKRQLPGGLPLVGRRAGTNSCIPHPFPNGLVWFGRIHGGVHIRSKALPLLGLVHSHIAKVAPNLAMLGRLGRWSWACDTFRKSARCPGCGHSHW